MAGVELGPGVECPAAFLWRQALAVVLPVHGLFAVVGVLSANVAALDRRRPQLVQVSSPFGRRDFRRLAGHPFDALKGVDSPVEFDGPRFGVCEPLHFLVGRQALLLGSRPHYAARRGFPGVPSGWVRPCQISLSGSVLPGAAKTKRRQSQAKVVYSFTNKCRRDYAD